MDRGLIVTTRGGELVEPQSPGGPIRLRLVRDDRPSETPCVDLINLGPVCSGDLARVEIRTLGDLRRHGVLGAFEAVMVDKLHRGQRQHLFHTMYLYALWGAVHNENVVSLSSGIRDHLKHQAAELKRDILGHHQTSHCQ